MRSQETNNVSLKLIASRSRRMRHVATPEFGIARSALLQEPRRNGRQLRRPMWIPASIFHHFNNQFGEVFENTIRRRGALRKHRPLVRPAFTQCSLAFWGKRAYHSEKGVARSIVRRLPS
jgi:hypothetical protein